MDMKKEIKKMGRNGKMIGRRDALKKAGKYAALTSATLMMLSPKAQAEQSTIDKVDTTEDDQWKSLE